MKLGQSCKRRYYGENVAGWGVFQTCIWVLKLRWKILLSFLGQENNLISIFFHPEEDGDRFLRNVGTY